MSHKIVTEFTNECLSHIFDEDQKNTDKCFVDLSGFCYSIRKMRSMIFVVLRKYNQTIQCVLMKSDNNAAFNSLTDLMEESTISITGEITKPPKPILSCTVTEYEIRIVDLNVITRAEVLPFNISNANNILVVDVDDENENVNVNAAENENNRANVSRAIRLENRWLDLRASNNYIIMQLRSNLLNTIRSIVLQEGFIEVSTPKIIAAVSESGSSVFSLDYFKRKAYLAQSPQLFKQMLINSGFKGVFEVGPVFRAENSGTYRHLCEFTGLDLEFPIEPSESHLDIINKIWSILYRSFNSFYDANAESIEKIFEHTKVQKLSMSEKPLMIDFLSATQLLRDAGFEQDPDEDIGSLNEKELGNIIKEKFGSDIFVLRDYPTKVRPFYTMAEFDKESGSYSRFSRSFDIIMRCNEISSGAQRNHDPNILKDRIRRNGIDLDFQNKSTGLEDYVRSFEYGSVPHGGCGIGVERLVMLYLGLPNVRSVSIFPRDPKTITP